jgi:alkylated DNA repair dioxygenase AlkB
MWCFTPDHKVGMLYIAFTALLQLILSILNVLQQEYSVTEHSTMPQDLCLLTQFIACTLGYMHYVPEATILNYYHVGSALGGHTDHSEFNHDAPLISLRFL